MSTFSAILEWLAVLSIFYFFIVNSIYFLLLIAAVHSLIKQARTQPISENLSKGSAAFAPSVSILAPAYNEQETIVASIKSFLMLDYPSFEVIVINDGSKDETLARLKAAFLLEETDLIYDDDLSKTMVRAVYRSKIHPQLKVVDKENGGKADALNIGIGFCRYGIFCAVDSDSILETTALIKVASPFLENPSEVIASGGTVRVANGASVRYGRVESVGLPTNPLVLMQVIEYTRAFLCGRIGWNFLNSTLIISGAFGLFSKDAVKEIGGYTTGSIGEDMELIIRLHKHCLLTKRKYSIIFVSDPVCWTEAPSDIISLGKQRDRWQRGLADTILRNHGMLMRPKFGFIGLFALPYFLFVELLGPIFELGSLIVIGLGAVSGPFDWSLLVIFFSVSLLYGTILSVAAIIIEEIYFAKYNKARQFLYLFVACFLESLWYRQLSSFWRLRGLVKYIKGDHSWGDLRRSGFSEKL